LEGGDQKKANEEKLEFRRIIKRQSKTLIKGTKAGQKTQQWGGGKYFAHQGVYGAKEDLTTSRGKNFPGGGGGRFQDEKRGSREKSHWAASVKVTLSAKKKRNEGGKLARRPKKGMAHGGGGSRVVPNVVVKAFNQGGQTQKKKRSPNLKKNQ